MFLGILVWWQECPSIHCKLYTLVSKGSANLSEKFFQEQLAPVWIHLDARNQSLRHFWALRRHFHDAMLHVGRSHQTLGILLLTSWTLHHSLSACTLWVYEDLCGLQNQNNIRTQSTHKYIRAQKFSNNNDMCMNALKGRSRF